MKDELQIFNEAAAKFLLQHENKDGTIVFVSHIHSKKKKKTKDETYEWNIIAEFMNSVENWANAKINKIHVIFAT